MNGYMDRKPGGYDTTGTPRVDLNAKRAMFESMRQEATIGFLQSALHPGIYNTPPPSVDLRSDFSKDGTVTGNFLIPSTALVNEMVPYVTGMLLWLCNNGLYTIVRQHFVPPGTVSQVGSGTNSQNQGLLGPQLDYGPNHSAPDNWGIILLIQYNTLLALPVSSTIGSNSPNDQVSVNFSQIGQLAYTRLYSGYITAISASTSIGNTALTGTFTAASIEDTRGIPNIIPSTAASLSDTFSVAALTQASETSKDYVSLVPSDQGVTVLLGDDVPVGYTNPQQDQTVVADGQVAVYNGVNLGMYEIDVNTAAEPNYGTPWTSAFSCQFEAIWVTPWGTQVQPRAIGFSATTFILQTFPIGETEALQIKMVVPTSIVIQSLGAQGATTGQIFAVATHIYATVDMTGTIQYSCFTEKKLLRGGNGFDQYSDGVTPQPNLVPPPSGNGPPFFGPRPTGTGSSNPIQAPTATQVYGSTAEFDALQFRQSYTAQGKYLGTYIAIAGGPSSAPTNVTGSGSPSDNSGYWFAVGVPTFYITAASTNLPGRVGPARIIRWDNLSQGMQLSISGKLWAQAIPTNQLAPYIKASIMGKRRWCDEAATTLLAALCSGPGPFRRVWNHKEYVRFANDVVPKLDLGTLVSYSANNDAALSALLDIAPDQVSTTGRRAREE